MGYVITRPDAEQLRFNSTTNGTFVLDDYLEQAEKGGRTLAALMTDIFDSSGVLRAIATPTDVANAMTAAFNAGVQAGLAQGYANAAQASANAAAASAASIAAGPVASVNGRTGAVVGVQDALVSGTTIKTIGGVSVLGSGDLPVGLIGVNVSGTSVSAASGYEYFLNNVALTAVTAPAAVDGARFAVTPCNGLLTNTIAFGAAIVRGPAATATGTFQIDLGARMEFLYVSAISRWVLL